MGLFVVYNGLVSGAAVCIGYNSGLFVFRWVGAGSLCLWARAGQKAFQGGIELGGLEWGLLAAVPRIRQNPPILFSVEKTPRCPKIGYVLPGQNIKYQ